MSDLEDLLLDVKNPLGPCTNFYREQGWFLEHTGIISAEERAKAQEYELDICLVSDITSHIPDPESYEFGLGCPPEPPKMTVGYYMGVVGIAASVWGGAVTVYNYGTNTGLIAGAGVFVASAALSSAYDKVERRNKRTKRMQRFREKVPALATMVTDGIEQLPSHIEYLSTLTDVISNPDNIFTEDISREHAYKALQFIKIDAPAHISQLSYVKEHLPEIQEQRREVLRQVVEDWG